MNILDYIEATEMSNRNETERAILACYFHFKETGESLFTMGLISELLVKSGFNAPNASRLKNKLLKGSGKSFLQTKGNPLYIEFIPVVLQKIEKEFGELWDDITTIESNSTLLDEKKFCGKRGYLTQIIQQINYAYEGNCYDAVAVLMRRLFEVLLILSYQNLGIDNEIKTANGDGYIMLEGIVNNAKNNQILKLSRIKKEFDTFRMVGNFSAHNITYTAGKKDIDDIKINYRVMLEELYNKAGLL